MPSLLKFAPLPLKGVVHSIALDQKQQWTFYVTRAALPWSEDIGTDVTVRVQANKGVVFIRDVIRQLEDKQPKFLADVRKLEAKQSARVTFLSPMHRQCSLDFSALASTYRCFVETHTHIDQPLDMTVHTFDVVNANTSQKLL